MRSTATTAAFAGPRAGGRVVVSPRASPSGIRPQPVPVTPQSVTPKNVPAAQTATVQTTKVAAKPTVTAEAVSGGESEIPCPACGTSISADAIMCYACGHRLHEESDAEEVSESENESETPCPACGTMISADAIMCYACEIGRASCR